MEQQVLTCQRGHHGSRNNASREEETTRERLSSLIRQKGLNGGRDDCCWVLLADSSRDRFVILEGIHESCWIDACNDEFQLVAVGNEALEDGCKVFWPGAKDLACVVHKIMRKKRNAANDSEEIHQESAIHGLLIYHLVGCEARFRSAEDEFWLYIPGSSVVSASLTSLELEMQMLSRVLKPPSVLAAASPSLLARGHRHLDDTASSSSVPLGPTTALLTLGIDNNPSEAGNYYELPELPMIMTTSVDAYTSGNMNMIITTTAGDGISTLRRSLLDLIQELAAAPPHFNTRLSGARGRNDDGGGGGGGGGGVVPALIEFLIRRWWRDYDLEAQRRLEIFLADSYLDAGRQAHRVAHLLPAAAAPVQEPSDIAKKLKGVMVQAFAAFLPTCVTAYPQVKDVPDHVKFTIFGGLAFITAGLFVGLLSKSVARCGLAFRLVSFSAIAVLAFSVASQLSSPTYIALTALVGVAVNLLIMLLRF